tara:strand:- start:242 stop:496 length:255 start_codon:yes stop_codon:yes gene_type:complete
MTTTTNTAAQTTDCSCAWCDFGRTHAAGACPVRAAQVAKAAARPKQTEVEFWTEMKGHPVLARCHRDPVMTRDVRAFLTADRNA